MTIPPPTSPPSPDRSANPSSLSLLLCPTASHDRRTHRLRRQPHVARTPPLHRMRGHLDTPGHPTPSVPLLRPRPLLVHATSQRDSQRPALPRLRRSPPNPVTSTPDNRPHPLFQTPARSPAQEHRRNSHDREQDCKSDLPRRPPSGLARKCQSCRGLRLMAAKESAQAKSRRARRRQLFANGLCLLDCGRKRSTTENLCEQCSQAQVARYNARRARHQLYRSAKPD